MFSKTPLEVEFVSYVVTALTGEPDCFDVQRSMDERGVLINLDVDKEHLGRVIGKEGDTAMSIRRLLGVLGKRTQAKYSLVIGERV